MYEYPKTSFGEEKCVHRMEESIFIMYLQQRTPIKNI